MNVRMLFATQSKLWLTKNSMSTINVALLSITLTVAHILTNLNVRPLRLKTFRGGGGQGLGFWGEGFCVGGPWSRRVRGRTIIRSPLWVAVAVRGASTAGSFD